MQHSSLSTSALAIAVASILAAANAAAEPQASSQLPEVVVTARQRAEKIEDVPVTVQAFTDTEIKSAGIERPADFIALTPGVAQVQTAEAGDLQVVIRGINTGRDAETNFALVVDGVLQTNPNALNQELNNVTQIEVLKGPQGALYGRNALAGAVIMTTRKPGDVGEVEVGAGYGTNNSYKGNLYMSGPLGEQRQGQPLRLYAQHRRPVEQHAAQLRRLRRLLRGDRRLGTPELRCRQRQLRREGEVLEGQVRRDQLQRRGVLCRGGGNIRRPALRRGSERSTASSIRTTSSPATSRRTRIFRSRVTGTSASGQLTAVARVQRPDQLLPDRRRERCVLPVCVHAFMRGVLCRADGRHAVAGAVQLRQSPGHDRVVHALCVVVPASVWADDLRRLPVPAARPEGFEPGAAPDFAGRPAAALARRHLLRRHRAPRGGLPGLRQYRRFAAAGLPDAGVRADQRPEPHRPAVRRHFQQPGVRRLRTARLRRGRRRRDRAGLALRLRAARRRQQRPDGRQRVCADADIRVLLEPVHQSRLHGEPGVRHHGHPEPVARPTTSSSRSSR